MMNRFLVAAAFVLSAVLSVLSPAAGQDDYGQTYATMTDAELWAMVVKCEDKDEVVSLLDRIPLAVMAKHAVAAMKQPKMEPSFGNLITQVVWPELSTNLEPKSSCDMFLTTQRWKDSSGKHGINAQVFDVQKETVIFQKKDGTQVSVPFTRLATSLQRRLEKHQEIRKKFAERIPRDKKQLTDLIQLKMIVVLKEWSRPHLVAAFPKSSGSFNFIGWNLLRYDYSGQKLISQQGVWDIQRRKITQNVNFGFPAFKSQTLMYAGIVSFDHKLDELPLLGRKLADKFFKKIELEEAKKVDPAESYRRFMYWLSDDGKRMLTSWRGDDLYSFKLWDDSGQLLHETEYKLLDDLRLAFYLRLSPTGQQMVVPDDSANLFLWNWDTGKKESFDKQFLNGFEASDSFDVKFTPSGEIIVLTTESDVRVWDIKNRKTKGIWKRRIGSKVIEAKISPDNTTLAILTLKGELPAMASASPMGRGRKVVPHDQYLGVGDGLELWDLKAGREMESIPIERQKWVLGFEFSPKRHQLAMISYWSENGDQAQQISIWRLPK